MEWSSDSSTLSSFSSSSSGSSSSGSSSSVSISVSTEKSDSLSTLYLGDGDGYWYTSFAQLMKNDGVTKTHTCGWCFIPFNCQSHTSIFAAPEEKNESREKFFKTMTDIPKVLVPNCGCHFSWIGDRLKYFCQERCCRGCAGEELAFCNSSPEMETLINTYHAIQKGLSKKRRKEKRDAYKNLSVNTTK